jgi:hypothetical protein
MRLLRRSVFELEDNSDNTEKREEGVEGRLLQVHECQREIQLHLLSYSSLLSNDQLQLEIELLLLFHCIY